MSLVVDSARLDGDMIELGRFGADPRGGFSRLFLTDGDVAARQWLVARMREAGLTVRVDSAWNIFGRWDPSGRDDTTVLTGSHIDTVIQGGGFDGVLGTLGALEAVRALKAAGYQPRHAIEVACFGGEEPVRFGRGMLGSRVLAGRLDGEAARSLSDLDGISLDAALRRAGRDPADLDSARLEPAAYKAFLELHIEQGPVLEEAQMSLGVVDVIAGSSLARIAVDGVSAHAGAMPMRLRRDALTAASEMILAVEDETRRATGGAATGTVGTVRPHPGANNVIPGHVEFDVDFRDRDQGTKLQLGDRLRERFRSIADRRGVDVHWEQRADDAPTPTDPSVRALLKDVCDERGETLTMPSGPFHDSVQIASIMPIGMIFVPSKRGLSHCPEEWTDLDQCVMGVTVLANALQRLSE